MENIYFILSWALAPGFFVAGAMLAGIPILIHILNRRRFKIVNWAAMEYLLAAMRKNRRRVQFEQMLLLAIRCLVLAMLGLALARPYACSDSSLAAFAGQRTGLHIFVIDNSYSMAYESESEVGKTHLDVAKSIVRRQIQQLVSGGESAAIVLVGKAGGTVGPTTRPASEGGVVAFYPGYDLRAAGEAADRVEQTYLGTDMAGALQTAVRLAREDKTQPVKYLHIYTDCAHGAWDGPGMAELMRQAGQSILSAFDKRVSLTDLSKGDQWNIAVEGLRASSGLVTPTFQTDFLADVKGYGSAREAIVQWRWDEEALPETQKFSSTSSAEAIRQSRIQIDQGGEHVLTVTVNSDDCLKADNTRNRVVQVASAMKALIVEGSRGVGALSGSGAYLDLSLAPKKTTDATGRVRSSTYVVPELIPDIELPGKVLSDYRAVILAGVPSVSEPVAEGLRRFVADGGTLITFMGDAVSTDSYNTTLLPRGLLPGRLVARKSNSEKAFNFDFNPNGVLHPVLQVFKGEPKTGLDTAQIFSYVQAEAPADTVVMRYLPDAKTGIADPAITLSTLGQGHVVFFSTTANSDWNALPQKPAYIALIHELLANSVDMGEGWMNLECGQSVKIPVGMSISGTPALLNPAMKPVVIDPATEEGRTTYVSKPLDKPGLYKLNVGSKTIPIAVNIPAEESDVRTIPAAAAVKALGIEVQIVSAENRDSGSVSLDDNADYGWALMMAVLGLVTAECLLAMRFGHYKKASLVKHG